MINESGADYILCCGGEIMGAFALVQLVEGNIGTQADVSRNETRKIETKMKLYGQNISTSEA